MKKIGALIAATLFCLFAGQAANAHTELISSSPEANSTIFTEQPITLTFNEPPVFEGSAIVLETSDGKMLEMAPTILKGNTLSVAWPEGVQPGYLTVNWRAVSDDGHVVIDSYTFLYSAAAQGGVTATEDETSGANEMAPNGDTPNRAVSNDDNELSSGQKILGGIAVVLLTTAIILALRNHRRK